MAIQNHGGPYLPRLMQKLLHMLLSRTDQIQCERLHQREGCHHMQGPRVFVKFFSTFIEMFLRMALEKVSTKSTVLFSEEFVMQRKFKCDRECIMAVYEPFIWFLRNISWVLCLLLLSVAPNLVLPITLHSQVNCCTSQLLSTNGETQVTCGRNLNVIYYKKLLGKKKPTCDQCFLNGLKCHLSQSSVQLFSSVVFSWCSICEAWESRNVNAWKAKSLSC